MGLISGRWPHFPAKWPTNMKQVTDRKETGIWWPSSQSQRAAKGWVGPDCYRFTIQKRARRPHNGRTNVRGRREEGLEADSVQRIRHWRASAAGDSMGKLWCHWMSCDLFAAITTGKEGIWMLVHGQNIDSNALPLDHKQSQPSLTFSFLYPNRTTITHILCTDRTGERQVFNALKYGCS